MAEVLIGQSYYLRFDPKLWRLMQPYPPLGAMLAAACLRSARHEVELFDSMLADSEQEWESALNRHTPKVAVLFEDNFNYLSKMCLLRMRQAAFRMIAAAKERSATVLVCGSDATDNAQDYLQEGADFVLLGEGEETLLELMERLSHRTATPFSEIAGLAFTEGDSETTTVTERRPVIRDLDGLAFPAWDLIDVERYRDLWTQNHGYFSMNIVTTRGCPYHCNWCAKPIWGQTYNSRSPQSVSQELERLSAEFKPDHIWFADDILALKPGWMKQFADEVEKSDSKVPFKCLSRVDLLLRDGEIDALRRAGAEIVWVGAESGSQKILDAMEKGTRVEQIADATRGLHAAGIRAGFFLQFGYPGELLEDIDLTLQMVRDCDPDEIGISVSYPLPGTRFHDRVKGELTDKKNWIDSEDLDMMFCGTFSTAFYRRLYTVVHKEFRARKAGREVLRRLRHPLDLRAGDLRLAAAAAYHRATLPAARLSLHRASRAPARGTSALPPAMTSEDAGVPTPQA